MRMACVRLLKVLQSEYDWTILTEVARNLVTGSILDHQPNAFRLWWQITLSTLHAFHVNVSMPTMNKCGLQLFGGVHNVCINCNILKTSINYEHKKRVDVFKMLKIVECILHGSITQAMQWNNSSATDVSFLESAIKTEKTRMKFSWNENDRILMDCGVLIFRLMQKENADRAIKERKAIQWTPSSTNKMMPKKNVHWGWPLEILPWPSYQ